MPRWVDCKRATFKYGLGDEFINILKVLHTLGLDSTEKVRVEGRRGQPARRGRRGAAGPRDGRPADEGQDLRRPLGDRQGQGRRGRGRRTSTTWSTTSGRCRSTATSASSGRPRSTRSSRSSCWPPAPGRAPGVLGPEAFDAVPFLDLLDRLRQPVGGHGSLGIAGPVCLRPWGVRRRTGPASSDHRRVASNSHDVSAVSSPSCHSCGAAAGRARCSPSSRATARPGRRGPCAPWRTAGAGPRRSLNVQVSECSYITVVTVGDEQSRRGSRTPPARPSRPAAAWRCRPGRARRRPARAGRRSRCSRR